MDIIAHQEAQIENQVGEGHLQVAEEILLVLHQIIVHLRMEFQMDMKVLVLEIAMGHPMTLVIL